jgi:uncharacterized protein
MPATPRPTALITGASSGIGLAIARELARRRHDLVLTARSSGKLQALADELAQRHGITAHVLVDDLLDPAAPARIRDHLAGSGIALDILVNNAGFGLAGPFAGLPLERQLGILQVNVVALTSLTGLLLPGLMTRPHARILNLASTAGFMPLPHLAVYAASKAYVIAFSEALSAELAGSSVTVTCLCPGATDTNFATIAGLDKQRLFRFAASAESVARQGVAAMFAGRRRVVTGLGNRLVAATAAFVPRGLLLYAAKTALR